MTYYIRRHTLIGLCSITNMTFNFTCNQRLTYKEPYVTSIDYINIYIYIYI